MSILFFTIFGQKFANFNKISYLCAVFDAAMVESVDTKDFEKIVFSNWKNKVKSAQVETLGVEAG